ncbi:polyprotein [Phytophthora megakarya]|uniref:Polyprotein n=1 Tax=Phytophthora megakarya TaxID=4795 RepID=A0A225WSY1_9STRA|nr:polyprotein [Phytophthora megakarya]
MAKHLDAFDELVVGLQTLGEPVDEARQMVVLLNSLPSEYELIASIVENTKDITLIDFKEKLLKENERLQKKETTEKAFRVNGNPGRFQGGRGNGRKGNLGHMKRDYPVKSSDAGSDAVFAVGEERLIGWLIDSGATSHMTPFREDLFAFEGMASSIELTGVNGKSIKMLEVLYIPGLDRRLLSVGKLAERGLTVEFQRSSCTIWGDTSAIATETKVGKAYVLECELEEARFVEYAGADSQWELWHAHMGHLNENAMIKTQRTTNGMPAVGRGIKSLCGGFMKGKQTVAPFPSREVHGYFLKNKSDVTAKLAEFKANGIMHQCTVPYSPQPNGVAERMNRTIMEKARSMLYYKGVSTLWWAEAVGTAVYLINRSTNAAHSDVTPYELGFKVKPRLEHLRVFGSQGYAHIDDAKRTKLEAKRFRCLLLGYAENAKGYRVYDLDASKVKVSRSVKLDEGEVGGIYDLPSPQLQGTVVHVTKDGDEATVPEMERPPTVDEPTETAEEPIVDVDIDDVEPDTNVEEVLRLPPSESTGLELAPFRSQSEAFQDRLVFHPEPERSRRTREPVFLLENGPDDEQEVLSEVCVASDYVLEQLDADTAFLNSDLSDLVYMDVPHGVPNENGMRSNIGYVYVCLYVDDMIIAARTVGEIREVKEALKNAFKMKLGTAKFILGMEIDHDTLMIKQTRYIDDVVERFGQLTAKAMNNPCASNLKLSKTQSPGTVDERAEMQSKPPDIAYVVTHLSRFFENPGLKHWRAAIPSATLSEDDTKHGIVYKKQKNGLKVEAFTDADWGSNIDDRRSVSEIMLMIGNAPVVFKSKFQRTVALSSAEAEYMALSLTKHVDIKHHFTRENVERETIKVDYIDTKRQLADLLTKALGTKTLKYLNNASGIKMKITAQ